MSNRVAHLEMLQGIINRLSQNSFLLKGWSVILISAMFGLADREKQPLFFYLAYFPAIVFWGLDGYFLRQERLFRQLYDAVRTTAEEHIDFSMDTSRVDGQVASWSSVVLSKTLSAFYGSILFSILVVTFFNT